MVEWSSWSSALDGLSVSDTSEQEYRYILTFVNARGLTAVIKTASTDLIYGPPNSLQTLKMFHYKP